MAGPALIDTIKGQISKREGMEWLSDGKRPHRARRALDVGSFQNTLAT